MFISLYVYIGQRDVGVAGSKAIEFAVMVADFVDGAEGVAVYEAAVLQVVMEGKIGQDGADTVCDGVKIFAAVDDEDVFGGLVEDFKFGH
jgi:hypothetical protein